MVTDSKDASSSSDDFRVANANAGFLEDNSASPSLAVGMATRVARGSLWGLGGQGVTLLISFIATPFIIRLMGTKAYGELVLINVVISYLAFTDLGMGMASTRFGASAFARGDRSNEAAVVWSSLFLTLVAAVSGALILIVLSKSLLTELLRLPSELHAEFAIAIRIAALGFVARSLAGILNTPQLVRLRFDLITFINVGTIVGQNLAIIVVLIFGNGVIAVVAIIALMSILNALIHAIVSRRLLPLWLKPQISPALIKSLLRFGGGLVLSGAAAMLLMNSEKLLLTRYVSVTALAHYSVAFTLVTLVAVIPAALSQSLLPAFSQLQEDSSRESLHRLYHRALRGNLLWIAPVAVIMCVAAKPFFTLWAGPEYGQESTLPFYILLGGALFNAMATIPYLLLVAHGRTGLIARFHLMELLPYLVCVVLFTARFGVRGAALAWSLRLVGDALIMFWAARRFLGFPFSTVQLPQVIYPSALGILVLPVMLLWVFVAPAIVQIVAVLASSGLYASLIWTRVLTAEERAWVYGMFAGRVS